MRELLISGAASVVLAVVGFALGRMNLRASTALERNEDLRRRRIDTYAAFCASIVEYRRAQLNRWFVGHDVGGSGPDVEQQRPEVAEDVRRSRATAWADFYRVLMICDDVAIEALARASMEVTRSMKQATSVAEVLAISDQVHAAVDAFARGVANSVLAPEQPPIGPARQPAVPRS
jgi:hypothetical protein